MPLIVSLDKKMFSPATGKVPLKRGDDWELVGKIVEKFSGLKGELEVDLTGVSATAYFEAATGGNITKSVTVTDAVCGKFEIDVPKEDTANIALDPDGQSLYAVLDMPAKGLVTAETESAVLEVKDREHFTS